MRRALVLLLLLAPAAPSSAQASPNEEEAAPEPTLALDDIVALRTRQPAPFAGLLIRQDDLVRWRLEIEGLRYRLSAETARHAEELAIRERLSAARLSAASERTELVESLWRARGVELTQRVREAEERAERSVWESPVLWFAVGLALGVLGMSLGLAAVAGAF